MAGMDLLPRMVVLKSLSSSGYACFVNKMEGDRLRGTVCCTVRRMRACSVHGPGSGSFPLNYRVRTTFTFVFTTVINTWARGEDDRWIVANSNHTNEDTSSPPCTLFDPKFTPDGLLYLTHVQSGKRVKVDPSTKYLYVDNGDEGDASDSGYGFIVIDRDSLVMLPKNIALKGDNNKYLKLVMYDGLLTYLQFSGSDPNHQEAALEIHTQLNGSIRIKSVQTGKFWRRGSPWVLANDFECPLQMYQFYNFERPLQMYQFLLVGRMRSSSSSPRSTSSSPEVVATGGA